MSLPSHFSVAALGALLALAGCVGAPPPQIATPAPSLPERYAFLPDGVEDAAQREPIEALLPLDDPAFANLARKALDSSPSLLEALERVEAARALANRSAAEQRPNIGAGASVTRSRTNPAQFGANLPPGLGFDTTRTAYAANLNARWDLDIFGQLKARKAAALARLDAADANARAVRLALIGELAASVTDWRTLEARLGALRADVEAASALAKLAEIRENAGLAPGFDRLRARALEQTAQSRLAALAAERNRLVGRIVALTAQPPSQVLETLSHDPQDTASPQRALALPQSLPSDLLTVRPDVARAAAELRAADAELAATARRRFPIFDLTGALGLLAFDPSDLFDNDSLVGSLAASLAAPLIDFGRLEAEIDAAAAQKRAAFQAYRAAVYRALGDAEAAYGLTIASQADWQAAAREAESLETAARLAETRYRAGLADFSTALEARRAALASRERAAAAHGRLRRARLLLWQALGGSDLQPISRSNIQ